MQTIVSSHRIPGKSSLLLTASGVPRQSPPGSDVSTQGTLASSVQLSVS